MDHSLTPEQNDFAIEEALRSYPLAVMPQDISANVLARIQAVPAPRPFRLTWSDLAIALVLSVCVAALWLSMQFLPPLVIAQIRKEGILFYQYLLVNARWLLPTLAFGLAALVSALTLPYLREELKRSSV